MLNKYKLILIRLAAQEGTRSVDLLSKLVSHLVSQPWIHKGITAKIYD
jgi:hypothetical protein